MEKLIWLVVALGIGMGGWFYPSSASALSFFKELVTEDAIPNAELIIDSQGNLHAAFLNNNSEVKYATRSLANWVVEGVETGGIAAKAKWVALALDSLDGVHVAFYDPVNTQVKYGQKVPGGWNIIPVASAKNSQCRLACYGSGRAYLAFNSVASETSPGRMFLANIDTAVPAVIGTPEEIDAGGNVGYSPSLALDASGEPHLTYYDRRGDKLKYAFKGAGGWSAVFVDSAPLAGWQSALILDKKRQPHIAYYDAFLGDLKYAYKDAYGWHISTLDSEGQVGQYPALASDGHGQLFFVYYDANRGNLKYAYKRNSRWVKGVLDQVGTGGLHITLADNNAGAVCLLYYAYDPLTGVTKLYYGAVALPRVYLTSPRGGEMWPVGSAQKISWRAGSSEIRAYKIQYSLGLGWSTIADNLPPGQKEYIWSVPSKKPAKNRCRIKILGQGPGGITIATDQSLTFIIGP